MGPKCFQHQLVEPPGLPLPCLHPVGGLAPNGARESQHLLNPKDKPSPTPSVQLSSLGCVYLPGTKEPGNGKSSTTWKLSSRSRGATLSSTPRGSGLASFMENQYQCPARERTQFTLHLLMDRFFPKRKDFGSESSSETEQRVVPVEPLAVLGCSGEAQNLK